MKNLLVLLLCCFAYAAQATIYTVSNDPNNPGQFTTLQDANDAANPGDTLYVTPSPSNYGNLTMNKTLTLIGQGYAPVTNGQLTYKTRIGTVYLSPTAVSTVDDSKFLGLQFNTINFGAFVNNISVERCFGDVRGHNNGSVNIKHSFVNFSSSYPSFLANISNSFIYSFYCPSSAGVIVKNCVIAVSSLYAEDCTFENNIFIQTGITTSRIEHSNFNNNIFSTYGDPLPLGISNNGGSGNLFDTNPLFVSYDFAAGTGGSYIDTEDYHLQATSPAVGFGTDGTDAGMYGGVDPFPGGAYTGAPPIPRITVFNLLNGLVGPNSQLNFEVEATTQN